MVTGGKGGDRTTTIYLNLDDLIDDNMIIGRILGTISFFFSTIDTPP